MATCTLKDIPIKDIVKMHNLVKDIKKSVTADAIKVLDENGITYKIQRSRYIARMVNDALKEAGLDKSPTETIKPHVVYRTSNKNGNKETSIDVYKIEKNGDGFDLMYVTPNTQTAKVIHVDKNGNHGSSTYNMSNVRATEKAMNGETKTTENEDLKDGQTINVFSSYTLNVDGKDYHVTWDFNPQTNGDRTGPEVPVGDTGKIKVVGHKKNNDMEYYVVEVTDANGKVHKTQPNSKTPLHVTISVNSENGIKPFMTGKDALKGDYTKVNNGKEFEGKVTVNTGKYNKSWDRTVKKTETKTETKTAPKTKPKAEPKVETKPESGQQKFEFNSESGSKIDYSKDNAIIIDAELINDMGKAEEIFNTLLQADRTELSSEHESLLRDTLKHTTDQIKKIIPDMIQVIKSGAEKNAGKVVLQGKNKGLYINLHEGAQKAGNQMSAAEMYVHELKHASLEYAQRFKKDLISDTMSDILVVYEKFLKEVTEEDFMPPLDKSIDREAERKIAKARIEYLRRPDVGVNEFIVMAETNLVVKTVLEERVTAGKDKRSGDTLFQKLIATIANLYNTIYTSMRGDTKNLDGYTAMQKYIREISALNNHAVQEIEKANIVIKTLSEVTNFLNKKTSTQLKKLIKKIQANVGTEQGKKFEAELEEYLANPDKYGPLDKAKWFVRMLGRWLASNKDETTGSFETWLELLGAKPEGTIQQLIRAVRDSDKQETLVESLGLQAGKVEYKVETALSQQSLLIRQLFESDLSEEDSHSLTKGILDIELHSLIDQRYNGSESEQINDLKSYLENDEKLNEEIDSVKNQIRLVVNNTEESNFMINQAIALGEYMTNGKATSGMLSNSYLIYGMANLDMSRKNINNRNKSDEKGFNKMLIDRLATLEGLKNTDKTVKSRLVKYLKNEPQAIMSIFNYDKMLQNQLYENNGEAYNINKVKGFHDRINSDYITPKVRLTTNESDMKKENYSVVSDGTYNSKYQLYVNMDYTEPGWAAEGIKMTNDGNTINSYINIVKNEHGAKDEEPSAEKLKKIQNLVKLELIEKEKEVIDSFKDMQKNKPTKESTGMRPVFATGKDGKFFVTDMDISVNKTIHEDKVRSNNRIDAVMAKTYARAIDVYESKKNNLKILDAIEYDMNENYVEGKNQGKKNLMSYVKIGPAENNEISKEIWDILPRYLKVEIIKKHHTNKNREIAEIAKELGYGENYDKIYDDKVKELESRLKKEMDKENPSMREVLKVNRLINRALHGNLNALLETHKNKDEVEDIKKRINRIKNSNPYIAVRRNLAYHYFGNREANILSNINSKNYGTVVSILKKIDMIWKHIVKITKANIVIRDLPVLMYNILSNFLLAIIQGRNPVKEVAEQLRGIVNLHRYREDNREAEKLKIKIKSGNHTNADVAQLKLLQNKINKNPVKPLVDAGLYTSATEDLSNDDLHKEGYLDQLSNTYFKKLPKGVKDVLNTLYMTKETESFRMLLLAMQYSDFAARYSTYYNLIANGVPKDKAIKQVLDNQINYGFNHGKLLQWLNARGLVMFSKFIERIQRVIRQTTIDKPFNVALAAASGGFLWEDSPLGDNAFSLNYGARVNSPMGIMETLLEKPALIQILTNDYS